LFEIKKPTDKVLMAGLAESVVREEKVERAESAVWAVEADLREQMILYIFRRVFMMQNNVTHILHDYPQLQTLRLRSRPSLLTRIAWLAMFPLRSCCLVPL
jgi:hypothetical protein